MAKANIKIYARKKSVMDASSRSKVQYWDKILALIAYRTKQDIFYAYRATHTSPLLLYMCIYVCKYREMHSCFVVINSFVKLGICHSFMQSDSGQLKYLALNILFSCYIIGRRINCLKLYFDTVCLDHEWCS